ncbi:putative reverse transcriptase domain-containing protein [Tanacetum coccineum]
MLPTHLVNTDLARQGPLFWGADDEEISEGGIPRVIVLGYDGLPLQPVAPPSPDFIPGPENPQTPPVPQDEDEREPMFIQAHDPNYVPEPIYPEYIPLEDDHEFQAEEQPLPPVDSPTAESPGYVTESDPEEDPEGYEDDETEDGPVDYPMDGGDDGDDDDGDSSRDDARDEDEDEEDEEDEEEEEHLAPADSTVIPTDEPVFPPEGTEPVIPPPSTDITIGARITVRPQTSISLPPEVERLLTMTTPSPSPPISLSPPSAGERLARCTAPPAHSPPSPPSSGCLTQIQTLRIASTQALIDAVTTALPPPSLPPLPPSLSMPSPVDHRDDIPESEQPPHKRLYLSTIGSRYEIRESSTARPARGQGIDYGFVSTVDAEERRQGIRDVGVVELAELHERDTQDLYALLEGDARMGMETVWMVEEEAYASREAWARSIGLSQATHQELQTHRDHVTGTRDSAFICTTELTALRETVRRRQEQSGRLMDVWNLEARFQITGGIWGSRKSHIELETTHGTYNQSRTKHSQVNGTPTHNINPESIQAYDRSALLRNSTMGMEATVSHGDNEESNRQQKGRLMDFIQENMDTIRTLQKAECRQSLQHGDGRKEAIWGIFAQIANKCHLHHNGPCTQRCHKCNKIGHFARDCRSTGNTSVANTQKGNGGIPQGIGCFEVWGGGVELQDTSKRDCPTEGTKHGGNGECTRMVYAVGMQK